MSTSRLRSAPIPEPTKTHPTDAPNPTTSIIPTPQTKASSFVYIMQSFGLLALILLIVLIGFQMTSNDLYDDIHKKDFLILNIPQKSTPSPTPHSGIEVIVHEDDGDIEIDVPQELPPDILGIQSNAKQTAKLRWQTLLKHKKQSRQAMLFRRQQKNKAIQQGLHHTNSTLPYSLRNHTHTTNRRPNVGPRPSQMINIKTKPSRAAYEPDSLPSIEQMSQNESRRFYSTLSTPAFVHGANKQCVRCPKRKFAVISGLYNTGTNVAFRLIAPNCRSLVKFQPGWGKHEMFDNAKIEHFNTHDYPASPKGTYDNSVLVVVVKDPLTWMKSMCKANYDFRYFNRTFFFKTCPTYMSGSKLDWFPMNRGKVMNRGANRTSNGVWESPIHLWNEWVSKVVYEVDAKRWPHLIVRFEDMLFRPRTVVPQFCKCLGSCHFRQNINENTIRIHDEVSKPHGNARNRTLSFWVYSNPEYRYEGYTKEDLQYMLDVIDPKLLRKFGYEFDVEKTKRMRM